MCWKYPPPPPPYREEGASGVCRVQHILLSHTRPGQATACLCTLVMSSVRFPSKAPMTCRKAPGALSFPVCLPVSPSAPPHFRKC